MAQVNVQYPALNQLFGAQSVMPAYYGTQQMMAAEESEKINQQQALQDTLFRAQDQEYDLKTKQANLDQSAAMLPGMQADAAGKVRTNAVRQGLSLNDEIAKAALAFSNDWDAEKQKALDYRTDAMLRSGDPALIEDGKKLSMLSRGIVQEQEKARALADREEKKIRMQGENSLAVARINAASRENTAAARPGSGGKSEAELMAKADLQKAAVYYKAKADTAMFEAEQMSDGPEKEALLRQAQNYSARADQSLAEYQRAQILRGQQAQAGKLDMAAASGMETTQAPQPRGFGGANPGATTPMPKQKNVKYATNPQTKQRLMSVDGGPWQEVK
jgi:hypothetical protein